MLDIISIGKILRDVVIRTSEAKVIEGEGGKLLAFPYKDKINVDEIQISSGGGAVNSAVAFSKLGKKVGILACVGNDPEGEDILNSLRMKFIDTDMIERRDEKTGISIILTTADLKEKDHTILIYRGANKFINSKTKLNFEKLNETKGWYISSIGSDDLVLLEKLLLEKKEEIKIAFNPGLLQIQKGFDVLSKYLQKVDVLFLNKKEAESFTGETGGKAIEKLKSVGPKIVAITNGKNGATVFDGEKIYFGSAWPVKAIEALGAGDAFGSTFFSLWLDSQDVEKALKYALINSAAALEKYGASEGLLTMAEIEKRLSENKDFEIIKKTIE
jgi:ribokinase